MVQPPKTCRLNDSPNRCRTDMASDQPESLESALVRSIDASNLSRYCGAAGFGIIKDHADDGSRRST